jgi:hypothetical protein
MPEPLHDDLRHTIHLCWKSLRGQEVFKAIEVNQELADMCPEEFSVRGQITVPLSCGSSANRLCQILCGSELKDYISSPDAIKLNETERLNKAMLAMKQSASYVLVRINVLGGGAGHSYIFLSKQRGAGEDLKGFIYQTNVGCHKDSAFDLIAWIDDEKSKVEVDLAKHFADIVKGFQLAPGFAYQENYMLSDKALKPDELADLKAKSKSPDAAKFCILWTPVVEATAMSNLRAIREMVPDEKPKAKPFGTVATPFRPVMTP